MERDLELHTHVGAHAHTRHSDTCDTTLQTHRQPGAHVKSDVTSVNVLAPGFYQHRLTSDCDHWHYSSIGCMLLVLTDDLFGDIVFPDAVALR